MQRYKEQDVAIVPLWEWRFLKRIEAAIARRPAAVGQRRWRKSWRRDEE